MTGFSSIEERRGGRLFQTYSLLLNLLRSARISSNIHFPPKRVDIFHPYQCHAHGQCRQAQGAGRPRRVLCAASPVSTYGLHGLASNRGISPWRCVGRARCGGVVSRAREGMQKVRSPCGSADLRGIPAVPEFAQWRSAFTRRLASASSLS